MKVSGLKEILKDVDDDFDVCVVTYSEESEYTVDETHPLMFKVNLNKSRVEVESAVLGEFLITARISTEDLHCCTECKHWNVMDGTCSEDGESYHGWEKACDRFVMETDTR